MGATQLLALALAALSEASHFRYGTIQWETAGGNSVNFRLSSAWKRSYWAGSGINGDGKLIAGDTFRVPTGQKGNNWYYGDDESHLLDVLVTDPVDANSMGYTQLDQAIGESRMAHTYATATDGTESWIAGFFGCCRLNPTPQGDPAGTLADGLNNNGLRQWNVQTDVDLSIGPNGGQDNSPVAYGKPILRLRVDFLEVFDIVAIDPEDDPLEWRLGTSLEMGEESNLQPGYGQNLRRGGSCGGEAMTEENKFAISTIVKQNNRGDSVMIGQAQWDTNCLNTGYWQATIMINGGKASIPYDFLMVLHYAKGNDPPQWVDPTPNFEESIEVECDTTLKFTVKADDPQKGGGEIGRADTITIYTINSPPPGLVPSAPIGNGPNGAMNPVSVVGTWPTTCDKLGKYVLCYQAVDDNPLQELDSPMHCVTIKVIKVEFNPPVFIDPTPLAPNDELGMCVGTDVTFTVAAMDSDVNEKLSIVFVSQLPGDAIVSEDTYIAEGSRKNKVQRTVTWNPSASVSGTTTICFRADEIKAPQPTGEGVKPIKTYQTEVACVTVSMRYPPVFDTSVVRPQSEGACSYMEAFLGQELLFTASARDSNLQDNVSIFILDDLPNGAYLSENQCPNTEGAGACNPAKRTLSFTPVVGQEGFTYNVNFRARDDKEHCHEGGYYSLIGQQGGKDCLIIKVVAPNPEWVDPTPPEEKVFEGYTGCPLSFCTAAEDPQHVEYPIVIFDRKGSGGLPEGAALGPQTVAGEGGRTHSRCFNWKPARGHEGYAYTVCMIAADAGLVRSTQRCWTIDVIRCKYCIQPNESLLSVAADYELDWIQLWGSNVDIKNPDHAYDYQLINLGAIYHVRAMDTLDLISERFASTPAHILSMNPDIANENDILDGQEICVCPDVCSEQSFRASGNMDVKAHDFAIGKTVSLQESAHQY